MITKAQFQQELDETMKDLAAFAEARGRVRARVLEVNDYPVERLMPSIAEWSGTDAVLGSLDLVVHALERTIEELKAALAQAPADPVLRLVGSDE